MTRVRQEPPPAVVGALFRALIGVCDNSVMNPVYKYTLISQNPKGAWHEAT